MLIMNIQFSEWGSVHESHQLNEKMMEALNFYKSLGPLPGFFLPLIEAFLPFLPLVVFVMVNAAAYGLLKGFLLSWTGTSIGTLLVFFIIRGLGNSRLLKKIRNNKQVAKVTIWVERHGFGPLFLLLCFPFSPSAVINIVAGLSKITVQQFILAVFLGKAVMIFSISYIGSSVKDFAQHPIRTIVVGLCIILFWMFGKYMEQRIGKKTSIQDGAGL
ncbi:TVP38/TMEM64 family protein [Virgibacillus kimchii]